MIKKKLILETVLDRNMNVAALRRLILRIFFFVCADNAAVQQSFRHEDERDLFTLSFMGVY